MRVANRCQTCAFTARPALQLRPGTNDPQPLDGVGGDHRPAEGHVCIFDFDNGVNDTLQEELRACNVTDWFTHGKSLRGIERGLCPNIGTDEYLQFTNTGTATKPASRSRP